MQPKQSRGYHEPTMPGDAHTSILAFLLLGVLVSAGRARDTSPPMRRIIDMHMHTSAPNGLAVRQTS